MNKNAVLVILIAIIYITIQIGLNSINNGYKENISGYFSDVAMVVPATIVILSKKKLLHRVVYALLYVILLAIVTELYWGYMDKPWFSPPENYSCDGPCYGWFSFENDAPTIMNLCIGIFSTIIGIPLSITINTFVENFSLRNR